MTERLPELRDVHERKGIPREPLDIENADQWPPHEIRRDT
jgi:hypothetical protein